MQWRPTASWLPPATGPASDDLGDDTWREGLEVLVHSLNTEAALNEMGVGAMTDQIVGYLVNRLLRSNSGMPSTPRSTINRSWPHCSVSVFPAPVPRR